MEASWDLQAADSLYAEPVSHEVEAVALYDAVPFVRQSSRVAEAVLQKLQPGVTYKAIFQPPCPDEHWRAKVGVCNKDVT